jgi:hypothetical protein
MASLYGILDMRDLARPVEAVTEPNVAAAIREYLDQWNSRIEALVGEYADYTTVFQERYRVIDAGGTLDPSDEYSRGRPMRETTTYYDVGYPLNQFDGRVTWTSLFLAKATVDRVDQDVDAVSIRDRNTLMRVFLRSLMHKTNYTFPDEEHGNIAVKRLYNGDGLVPPTFMGEVFDNTHTHYLATNNAAITKAFLDIVYEHLAEHGLGVDVVLEVGRNVASAIELLTGFVANDSRDPKLRQADPPDEAITGNSRAIGRISNMEVRVSQDIPDNYGFATDLAGDPPVVMREDPEDSLRGLVSVQDPPNSNFPLRNSFFRRRIGAGVRNRANGVCFQVVASATYTDPTILISANTLG